MNWKISYAALVLSLSVSLSRAGIASADSLRLEDAIRLALQNNERAKKTPLRVEIADAAVDRARDAFFPTLTGSGSSTYHPVTKGPDLATSGALTLTQPLFSPSSIPQFSQQLHNRSSEKWGAVQDERQLAFDTAKAFIQALASESVLTSAERKLASAKTNLDTAQARAQTGLNSTNDVTKAELQLATSQGQLASAQGNAQKTRLALSFLVGRSVAGELVPPDNTTKAAQHFEEARSNQVTAALLARREHWIEAAQARRADVQSLHEKNEGLDLSAQEPLYRLFPSLNASGQLKFIPDSLPSEKGVDEQASLNLSWQIFDAGLRYADRKQRLAQLASGKLDEHLLRRSVESDIQTALVALRAARANFDSAIAAVAAAEKNTAETTVLYQQGLAIALDVSDANDKQFDADVTRDAAKLSMEQAYLDLRSALGFGPLDDQKDGAK